MPSDIVPAVGPAGIMPISETPPHPLDGQWSMRVDGREFGPYSGRQLETFVAEGRLEPHTEVRRPNGLSWISARDDMTLRRLFPDESKPPVTASRGLEMPHVKAAQGSTVVQVTNTIQAPQPMMAPIDMGSDKSPGVALLLSLLLCGAGQLYNGQVGKGILMFIGCVVLWALFLGWIINIWSMIDAYGEAKSQRARYHAALAGARRW